MYVDSTLQVYTTIVAWKYYSLIWSLLVASGIVFIPIVMALIGEAIEARGRGSTFGNNSESVLSAIEVRLLQLFIILFFVAMPVNFVQLSPESVLTYENVNDLRSPPNVTVGAQCDATNTGYDNMTSPMSTAICSTTTGVPMWWYATLRLSHAITQTVVNEVTAQNNNGMRALTSFAQGAKIESSYVRSLHNQFLGQCYDPALSRYSQESSGQVVGPGNEDPGFFGRDTSWIGSEFWIETYYANLTTQGPITGMPFVAALNPQYDPALPTPEAGRQQCDDFWIYLSDQIYAEAISPAAGDNRQGTWNRLQAAIPGLADNAQRNLVQLYLRNTPGTSQQTLDRINALKAVDKTLSDKVISGAGQVFQGAEFIKLAFVATMLTDALLKVLPILQAYFAMFIVFMLPFGLVMSGYSWEFVLQASVLLFFVVFWSALWGFAAWVDESMARALWPGGSDGLWGAARSFLDGEGLASAMNKLIHSVVTAATYVLGPVFAGLVLSAAGFRAVSIATGIISPNVAGTGGAGAVANVGNTALGRLNGLGRSDSGTINRGLKR